LSPRRAREIDASAIHDRTYRDNYGTYRCAARYHFGCHIINPQRLNKDCVAFYEAAQKETLSHVESSRTGSHRDDPNGNLGDASAGRTPDVATQDDHAD
jgi:hypothetical protein